MLALHGRIHLRAAWQLSLIGRGPRAAGAAGAGEQLLPLCGAMWRPGTEAMHALLKASAVLRGGADVEQWYGLQQASFAEGQSSVSRWQWQLANSARSTKAAWLVQTICGQQQGVLLCL